MRVFLCLFFEAWQLELINIKRGDTFSVTCAIPLAFGQSLTGVSAQVRRDGALTESLLYSVLAPTATEFKYALSATATQTAAWALGRHICDIQYTAGSVVASTETFGINVIRGVTE